MYKDKKTILFLLNRECTYLPPFMAILDCLCENYCLKVVSRESKDSRIKLEQLYKGRDVEFLYRDPMRKTSPLFSRIGRKLRHILRISSSFHRNASRLLETTPHNLLWIIHEETAFIFRKEIKGRDYIVSLYELNDHRKDFLNKLRPILVRAKELLVPEYNRACILRVWLRLDKTPTVVPNKPFSHPRNRNIPNSYQELLEGKRIIIYQGYINRNRNLDKVCEAVKNMPGYSVVLLGKGDTTYIDELKHKYERLIHIPFIIPPEHLKVTSWAHIAIVKYDFVALNAIFCAPNKTWEYTGFGIPILCHDIPGLRSTIGQYGAGECIDMDNLASVEEAIRIIDSNYERYSQNAKQYFESFDVKQAFTGIAKRNLTVLQ